jgi:hypothetical protein
VVTRESSIPDYGWLEKVGKEEVSNRFVEMRHPTPFTLTHSFTFQCS